jgi:16S rRNA processing protein RimM
LAETVLLGVVIAAHGLRGEVRVKSFAAHPESLGAYGPLMAEDGARFTVSSLRVVKEGGVILGFAEVKDRNQAEALRGTRLHVARAALPAPDDDEFYLADLVGLAVEDDAGAALGTVRGVHNFGAGDVLEIGMSEGDTEFVPFTRAAVPLIDLAGGRVVVAVGKSAGDTGGDPGG